MYRRSEGLPIQVRGESRQPLRELGDFFKLRLDDHPVFGEIHDFTENTVEQRLHCMSPAC